MLLDWLFDPLRISRIVALTLESARMMRHMWETMRVWMRLLSFMELRAEEEGGGCEGLRWENDVSTWGAEGWLQLTWFPDEMIWG